MLLKRRELEIVQPGREVGGSQRRSFGDRLAGHAYRERFRFEPRATASRTRLGELVLPQEHPDVLLVALFFEPLEKGKDPEVAAFRVVEQEVPLARRQVFPTYIQANALCPGGLAQQAPTSFVAGLGPGIERAGGERPARIRHDQRLVVFQHRAEAVASGTRAAGIIEGKERRCEHRGGAAAGRAGGVLGEAPPVAIVERQGHAFTFAECSSDGVGESATVCFDRIEPIDDDEHVLTCSHALLGPLVIQAQQLAIDLRADESCRPKLCSDLDIWTAG
jgi:hypothetical protein